MTKKIMVLLFTLLLCSAIYSQSLSQLGFIIKKAMPNINTISVIFNKVIIDRIEREARPAILITKMKYIIFPVEKKSDIAKKISQILKIDNVAILVITDKSLLAPSTIQFIAQKTLESQIPVITNRSKDTLQGALLSIFSEDSRIKKHVNKITASALSLELPEAFLAECTVDAE